MYLCPRRPLDEHVVVREGEEYSPVFNDTSMIGEEINISYTVPWPKPTHWMRRSSSVSVEKLNLLCLVPHLRLTSDQLETARDMKTPPLNLTVTYPHQSHWGNNLLYLTHVTTSPSVHTHTRAHACFHTCVCKPAVHRHSLTCAFSFTARSNVMHSIGSTL